MPPLVPGAEFFGHDTDLKMRGYLKDLPLEHVEVRDGKIVGSIEKLMATAAATFVPFEVVFPPLEIPRLGELEDVREALRNQAKGTGSSLINAFGLHFNPELPNTDVATILDYVGWTNRNGRSLRNGIAGHALKHSPRAPGWEMPACGSSG
jgi:hypothetical protein